MKLRLKHVVFAFAAGLIVPSGAHAAAILAGFNTNTLPANDDSSAGPVNIGFTANFFGLNKTTLFVNNNGNVTFDAPLGAFTPFDLTSTSLQIIAPFFADVDTRNAGSPVTYGLGSYEGRNAFGVNWVNVDYFLSSPARDNLNSFQLILVDRSDIAAGDFDIIFNYDQILWESGDASGGDSSGLGGFSARAGFSNFELLGSAVNGAFLDGGPNALISGRFNSDVDGRYIFAARAGTIPEPATVILLGMGCACLGIIRRRRLVSSEN